MLTSRQQNPLPSCSLLPPLSSRGAGGGTPCPPGRCPLPPASVTRPLLPPQVKAELRKHWVRFLLARPSGCKAWVLEGNFRCLRTCPKKPSQADGPGTLQKLQPSSGSDGQLLHLSVHGLGGRGARCARGHAAWPRGSSVSESSEGDFTLTHTMEEILEESEI